MSTPRHTTVTPDLSGVLEMSRRRTGRVRSVLALGVVVGLGVLGTTAAFSDTATVTAGFTAGTLDITVDDEQGNPTPYTLTFAGADALVPGQTVYAPLELANVGTVDADLSLAVSADPDGSVANATDELEMTIVHTTGTACDDAVVTADVSPYVVAGPIAAATFSDVELDGGDTVDLCVAVELPGTVTGTGGGSTDVELTFLAEQSAI